MTLFVVPSWMSTHARDEFVLVPQGGSVGAAVNRLAGNEALLVTSRLYRSNNPPSVEYCSELWYARAGFGIGSVTVSAAFAELLASVISVSGVLPFTDTST